MANKATTATYDDALARINAFQAREGDEVNPLCRTALLTHGQRVERAITFLHGFTSCPKQFDRLGQRFYERGYNVFIPREPNHGLADRMTTALVNLTAESMRDLGRRAVEVTRGLGEHVTICGLSMGGTLAAWIAQHFEIDLAVIIAPSLEVTAIPHPLHRLAAEIFLRMPNFFVWWDPKTKLNNPNRALFGYPRYASRALAESWRLAYALRREARQTPPAARCIIAISNANDHTVHNQALYELTRDWQRLAPGRVETHEFPVELGLLHDFIGPYLPGQKIDVVYPALLELIDHIRPKRSQRPLGSARES